MSERTEIAVYKWEDEHMTYVRRIEVEDYPGLTPGLPLPGHVLAAITAEIHDFPAGLYRAIPVVAWLDFEVESKVILP